MILAGIDEAGLGPNVGPLATACAALLTPDDWQPATPWQRLAAAFIKPESKGEACLTIADSKVIYRAGGIAALELAVGAFTRLAYGSSKTRVRHHPRTGSVHPCYTRKLRVLPAFCRQADLIAVTERLAEALRSAEADPVHLEAALTYEPALNSRFDDGLNKNQALLLETGNHLQRLAERFPDKPILAVIDKQGGRNQYLPFLSALFPGRWIDTLEEGAAESRYRIRRAAGADINLIFAAKADRDSFATALASMAAKYARECAMAELNAWFSQAMPDVAPTAGYPTDARRWRVAVEAAAADLNSLRLELLWRNR
ncbi:MAG: hypothetical protein LIP23_09815 [Planctomycetes bacterium]|nr:hypothetical protein [Planctomycetota bacterium]